MNKIKEHPGKGGNINKKLSTFQPKNREIPINRFCNNIESKSVQYYYGLVREEFN